MNFIRYEGFIGDGEAVYEGEINIHPFSIEAFMGVEMTFTPPDEREVSGNGVKIYFKSGLVIDIMIELNKFKAMIETQSK